MFKPNYVRVFAERHRLLESLKNDNRKKVAFRLHYKHNPIDFVNDWCITYDPRTKLKTIPFLLFKRQKEYIEWLADKYYKQKDGIVEKPRDCGITWLNVVFSVWLFIFHEGVKIGFGSRKEMLVDRIGDNDSIFEKIRLCLLYLPQFITPQYTDGFCKIINESNGSTITGEAGDNIGRGGRSSIYFKDESAFYERPEKIESAISMNADCKIDCSTPNGTGNPFYVKRMSGEFPVFTFHWTDDPRKNKEWYEEKKRTLSPVILAQEVDIDYTASVEGICIHSDIVIPAINFQIERSGRIIAMLDVADEGGDKNVYMVRHGVVVIYIEEWSEGNTTQSAQKADLLNRKFKVAEFRYDSIGVGSGIKGEMSRLKEVSPLPYSVVPFTASASPSVGVYPDVPDNTRKNSDVFKNLRAESAWKLRDRFERTYKHINGIAEYDSDDLISIPKNINLQTELSQPKYDFSDGKIKIESKEHMKKRGIKSPNYFDCIMGLFAPIKQKSWFFT